MTLRPFKCSSLPNILEILVILFLTLSYFFQKTLVMTVTTLYKVNMLTQLTQPWHNSTVVTNAVINICCIQIPLTGNYFSSGWIGLHQIRLDQIVCKY